MRPKPKKIYHKPQYVFHKSKNISRDINIPYTDISIISEKKNKMSKNNVC